MVVLSLWAEKASLAVKGCCDAGWLVSGGSVSVSTDSESVENRFFLQYVLAALTALGGIGLVTF